MTVKRVRRRRLISVADAKELARLVRKYGRETIGEAAAVVQLRGPGRPSRGDLPRYEKMHVADWIDQYADEHREAGSKSPVKDAMLDLYAMEYSGEPVEKFLDRVKQQLRLGRRDLKFLRAALEKKSGVEK